VIWVEAYRLLDAEGIWTATNYFQTPHFEHNCSGKAVCCFWDLYYAAGAQCLKACSLFCHSWWLCRKHHAKSIITICPLLPVLFSLCIMKWHFIEIRYIQMDKWWHSTSYTSVCRWLLTFVRLGRWFTER